MRLRRGQVVQLRGPLTTVALIARRSRTVRHCDNCDATIQKGDFYAAPDRGTGQVCADCVEERA